MTKKKIETKSHHCVVPCAMVLMFLVQWSASLARASYLYVGSTFPARNISILCVLGNIESYKIKCLQGI